MATQTTNTVAPASPFAKGLTYTQGNTPVVPLSNISGATAPKNNQPWYSSPGGIFGGVWNGIQGVANGIEGNFQNTLSQQGINPSKSYTDANGNPVPNLSAGGTINPNGNVMPGGGISIPQVNQATTTPQSGVGTKIISGGGASQQSGYYSPYSGKLVPYGTADPANVSGAQIKFATSNGSPLTTSTSGNTNTSSTNTNNNTSSTKTNSNGTASTFQGLLNDQANTVPYAQTTTAVGNSNNIGTGTGLTATQQQQQNNINQGAQTSANIAQNQTPGVLNAERQYQNVANNPFIQGALTNSAMAENVSAGAGQQFASNYANQLSNANQNVQNALTGQGQQLTGAQQQAAAGVAGQGNELTGAGQAGNLANTAQGNQISAQNNATQNLLDSLTQQGYVILNKTTGQPLDSAGAAAAATQGAGIQSAYNNALAGGTAVTSANATGLQNSIQQEQTLNTAATAAQKLSTQVTNALQNSGLNMTNSTDANSVINNLQSRLGNAAYTQLNIAVNDAQGAYAQILGDMGYNPTQSGTIAAQNINSNMTPNEIIGAINQLNQGVVARQQAVHQQTQSYSGALGQGGSSSTTSNSGWSSLGD